MSLFHPNTKKFNDYIERGRFVMLWRITMFFIVAFLTLAVSTWFYDKTSSVIYGAIFLVAILCLVYLGNFTKIKFVCYAYAFCGTLILGFSCNLNTGLIHTPDFFWAFAVIVFTFTTLGSKMGWFVIGCFSIIMSIHFYVFFEEQLRDMKMDSKLEMVGVTIEILFALSVTGYFISQHLIFLKYTEGQMSLANAELELQNQIIQRKSDENAVLVKEIHHRVKNNLQIIISLLRMHRDEVGSAEARQDFDEAINRILSMALLHQQMYRERELSRFSLEDYLKNLAHDIIASYKHENQIIQCDIRVTDVNLKLEEIVPLGLMVNELISNSLKHAFRTSSTGSIGISIESHEQGFFLRYADNGAWVDDELLVNGFGLDLVSMLGEQLNGTLVRKGSTFELTVKNL